MQLGHPTQEKGAIDENLDLLEEIKEGHASIESTMEALMDFEEEILTSQPKHQDPRHSKGAVTCSDEELHGLRLQGASKEIVAEVLHGVSSQLAKLEQVLGSLITQNMQPICRVSAQMAELRKENARFRAQLAVESDVAELRLENEQLRAYMASAGVSIASSGTAGTGESSCARPEAVMVPLGASDGTTGGSQIVKDNSAALRIAPAAIVTSVSSAASSSGAPPGLKNAYKQQSEASDPPHTVRGQGNTTQQVAPPSPVTPVIAMPQGSAPELDDERDSAEENASHPLTVQCASENAIGIAADQPEGDEGGQRGSDVSEGSLFTIMPTMTSSPSSKLLSPQMKKGKNARFSTASNPGIRVSPIPSLRISHASTGSDSFPPAHGGRMSRFQESEEKRKKIKRGLMSLCSTGSKQSHAQALKERPSVVASAFHLMRGNAIRFEEEQPEVLQVVARKGIQQDKMFADANAMKERLREAIGQPKYDVANYYFETGFCQRIARAGWFENLTLLIIALNALWIAVDTEYNNSDVLIEANPVFQVAENLFCLYFTMEWTIRFASFEKKKNCLRDGWFVFDSGLVAMMVSETWILSIVMISTSTSGGGFGDASVVRLVKLLRLSRMARMAKLLVAMPELNILLKGIACAGRSVFFTLLLLTVILYIFGIAFTQLLIDTPAGNKYFPNLPTAMVSLLLHGTFLEDLPTVVKMVGRVSLAYGAILMLFVLVASLTVMNMLIGILCEVVSVVSAVEKENCLLQFVKARMQDMLTESGLDADGDGMITKSEFEKLIEIPEAARALQEVGVDVLGLVDSSDFIFGVEGDTELTFVDFMDVVLQLRGTNTATVKDIVDLRKFFTQEISQVEENVARGVVHYGRSLSGHNQWSSFDDADD